MCGIAGYIGHRAIDKPKILETLNLMKNRGPDHQSYATLNEEDLHISLLHSRLSIIDLDQRSNQPFIKEHCVMVFNGEIYNYIELRKKLQNEGHWFKTDSDTEVLLTSYLAYGEECVKHLEGMWSFAIYDKREKKLFMSRDRFAEKPLYTLETKDGFYFASEVRFLKSLADKPLSVNKSHALRYLVNGHKSLYKTNDSFFNELEELSFATNLTIDRRLNKKTENYWRPNLLVKKMTLNEAIEGTRHHLLESVKLRLRSDVPLAFCLSGGVDSASLASIASKKFNYNVVTFSIIDKDKRYDERENIEKTIQDISCKNIKINLNPKEDNLQRLKDLIRYHGTPVATISYFIHSLLSEQISNNGYKIAISGTGADELFTGYYDHHNLHLYEMRHHPKFNNYLKDWETSQLGLVRNPFLKNPRLYFENPAFREHIYLNNDMFAKFLRHDYREEFTENNYCDSLLRNRMLNELFHEVVRVILHEDDLNSMKYSVENRSPFLDTNLFNFAYSIPSEHLINHGYAKHILRESVKGILNDDVRLTREKKGFNASITSIIDFNSTKERDYILSDGPIYDIIDREKISKLIQQEKFSNSYKKFLFNFINLKIFLDQQKDGRL